MNRTSNPLTGYAAALSSALCLTLTSGCSDSSDRMPVTDPDAARINQLQYLGTHNSYHIQPRDELAKLLLAYIPDDAPALAYTHVPLPEQFVDQGIRQIELDVFHDPEGGLYAEWPERTLFGEDPASGIPELDEPGLKVLHVQEIDYETTCYTFVNCLEKLRTWSDANPGHLPVMVLVEAKDEAIEDPLNLGFSVPLAFDAEALDGIDTEIRSVFPDERIILPDYVRNGAATLEQAILDNGWPSLSEARGRVIFALDNGGSIREDYIAGHTSLEGRVMFTDSPTGTPEAAFVKRNNPLSEPGAIEELVELGYLVRTRADADTVQSRNNDTTQRDAALASGAHYISTDYPVPNPAFSDYQVTIPGGRVARCNPISPGLCTDESVLE